MTTPICDASMQKKEKEKRKKERRFNGSGV
jgi:hypothetical protein